MQCHWHHFSLHSVYWFMCVLFVSLFHFCLVQQHLALFAFVFCNKIYQRANEWALLSDWMSVVYASQSNFNLICGKQNGQHCFIGQHSLFRDLSNHKYNICINMHLWWWTVLGLYFFHTNELNCKVFRWLAFQSDGLIHFWSPLRISTKDKHIAYFVHLTSNISSNK